MTPYEKFAAIPSCEKYLKDEVTLADLDAYAGAMTDNQAAHSLQEAKRQLFAKIFKASA